MGLGVALGVPKAFCANKIALDLRGLRPDAYQRQHLATTVTDQAALACGTQAPVGWPHSLCRGITGHGIRATFDVLAESIPLTVHEVPPDTQFLHWKVFKERNIRDAHTTDPVLDEADFVKPDAMVDTGETVWEIFVVPERNRRYVNLCPYGEPQHGIRGLYDSLGGRSDAQRAQLAMSVGAQPFGRRAASCR